MNAKSPRVDLTKGSDATTKEALAAKDVSIVVARGAARKTLVEGVSLAVRPGEVLALIGPNGAGKSTLLGALAGTRKPDQGVISIDGEPLHALMQRDPLALARRRAVLPQAEALGFPLTVLEVVLLGRYPHLPGAMGKERPHDLAVAWRALDRVGARHLVTRAFPTLSGGERQRVRIARALAQIAGETATRGARYLLLDEPCAGLDLAHARGLHTLIREEADAAGVGVVVVEHDLSLAATASRVAVLSRGRLVALGPPATTLTARLLGEVFGLPGGFVTLPAGGLALDLPPLLSGAPG